MKSRVKFTHASLKAYKHNKYSKSVELQSGSTGKKIKCHLLYCDYIYLRGYRHFSWIYRTRSFVVLLNLLSIIYLLVTGCSLQKSKTKLETGFVYRLQRYQEQHCTVYRLLNPESFWSLWIKSPSSYVPFTPNSLLPWCKPVASWILFFFYFSMACFVFTKANIKWPVLKTKVMCTNCCSVTGRTVRRIKRQISRYFFWSWLFPCWSWFGEHINRF